MQTPVQRWETRVIHLNLSPPKPKPPQDSAGSAPKEPAETPKPIFSETYLKEEFPNHYAEDGASKAPRKPQHPATQLQGFMNKLGQEGWEFVGVFPIGQLVMMTFRRPLPPADQAAGVAPAQQAPPHSPAAATAAPLKPDPAASAAANDPIHQLLEQILQRLERLEQRPSPPTPLTAASAIAAQAANRVLVLDVGQLQQLPQADVLSTARAAQALGLRSPASLLNFGARHGYQLGLVKLASNGMAAVYRGTEERQSGGKAIRLWQGVAAEQLPKP